MTFLQTVTCPKLLITAYLRPGNGGVPPRQGKPRGYWFTPLARNPPSTTRISPVTKAEASLARKIADPTSSTVFPNRPIGVRISSSLPRSLSSSSFWFSAVRKTPGAIAFTVTPCELHSTASDFVSAPTAALLAAYAVTSFKLTNVFSEAMLMIRPYPRSSMCLPKIWHARSVPVTFVSIIPSQVSSQTVNVDSRLILPAQLITISTLPNSFTVPSTTPYPLAPPPT